MREIIIWFVEWTNKQLEDLDVVLIHGFRRRCIRKETKFQARWLTMSSLRILWSELKLEDKISLWIQSGWNLTRVSQHLKVFTTVLNFLICVILEWFPLQNYNRIVSIDLQSLWCNLKTSIRRTRFAREGPSLNEPTLLSDIYVQDTNSYLDDEDDSEKTDKAVTIVCGNNCLIGCLKVPIDCNSFSVMYETFYVVYKTVLTLLVTQVCCERAFSTKGHKTLSCKINFA